MKTNQSIWYRGREFREVPGLRNRVYVSKFGDLISIRPIKAAFRRHRYKTFCCGVAGQKRTVLLHRAICLAWIGPPKPRQQARHLDGKRKRNRLDNLAWGTSKQNGEDKANHGTAKGECSATHKLSDELVRKIRREIKRETSTYLGMKYGLSRSTIHRAASGRTWSHLPGAVKDLPRSRLAGNPA